MASASNPPIDFKELKSNVSMLDVLQHYGLLEDMEERKDGQQLVGPSPFRQGKSRTSFKVDLEKGCWYDFGLKRGGSVIDFVVVKEGVGLRAAAEHLVSWFEVEGEPERNSAPEEPAPNQDQGSPLDLFSQPPLDRAQVFFALALLALGELDEAERQRQTIRFAKALVLKLGA